MVGRKICFFKLDLMTHMQNQSFWGKETFDESAVQGLVDSVTFRKKTFWLRVRRIRFAKIYVLSIIFWRSIYVHVAM